LTNPFPTDKMWFMTSIKTGYRVVVRSKRGHLLSATDTMPEGRANSILRKMMSGDQVDTEFETVSVELATVDNDPADAREGWI
jgi:hypothetical protein